MSTFPSVLIKSLSRWKRTNPPCQQQTLGNSSGSTSLNTSHLDNQQHQGLLSSIQLVPRALPGRSPATTASACCFQTSCCCLLNSIVSPVSPTVL
ncbi:hypothetical protein Pmani_031987 [Petrolisthes manimaculis]|uniref:Uncharacterized protein n=1 Tax=Petrolisthes manimaculis TaxID=1843537 RepID=A0AAE1NU21_9EUCA|nr:hypothetical protein Pmani_031987 [Petrolisthes manimaculis]